MAIGQVQTGIATTLRLGSKDAGAEAKAIVDKATQEAKAMKPTENQIKYVKQGEPVFNCFSKAGYRIEFSGGAFIVDKKSSRSTDLIESLQHFVDNGILIKEEA